MTYQEINDQDLRKWALELAMRMPGVGVDYVLQAAGKMVKFVEGAEIDGCVPWTFA